MAQTRLQETSIPDWHRELLEQRLKAYRANPSEGRPWEEVQKEILEKLQRRRSSE